MKFLRSIVELNFLVDWSGDLCLMRDNDVCFADLIYSNIHLSFLPMYR